MDIKPPVLVIENSPLDVTKVVRILQNLKVDQPVVVLTSVAKALMYLEDVVAGEKQCPELIVLDLEFGAESGFEILRFRKANPGLQQCQVLVWTVMGEREKELCRLFGITHILSKKDGDAALESALRNVLASRPPAPADPATAQGKRADHSST
jgi:CheY-like chemotaxis protein